MWSKDNKQQLAGTGGRVNGHARNRENRRQQYRENRSAHMAMMRALIISISSSRTAVVAMIVYGAVGLVTGVMPSQ